MATAKSARKTTAKKPAAKKATKTVKRSQPETVTVNFDDPIVIAKIKAYTILKEAGLPIPEELSLEVEALVAAATKQEEERLAGQYEAQTEREKEIEKANKTGPVFIRNGYPSKMSIRLERQQEEGKKKIELSPRGERGDLFPLQEGDLEDPAIKDAVRRGLIEVVGNGTAQDIMEKQTVNMQTQHVPLVMLRNEHGGTIEKVTLSSSNQGVVVAVENPNNGEQQENVRWSGRGGADGGLIRPGQQVETTEKFVPTMGNQAIITSGFASNESLAKADALARQKGSDGPGAGLAGLTLTVEPTKRA